jgi:hypothetical protein
MQVIPRGIELTDLATGLDAVSFKEHTLQTMVFEPAGLRLHVALGACPSSAFPLQRIELAPLFAPAQP